MLLWSCREQLCKQCMPFRNRGANDSSTTSLLGKLLSQNFIPRTYYASAQHFDAFWTAPRNYFGGPDRSNLADALRRSSFGHQTRVGFIRRV